MRRRRDFAVLAVFTLFFTGCATSNTANIGQGRAVVRNVQGNAETSFSNNAWRAAGKGKVLHSGDKARTGANGRIDFDLGRNGGVLILMPDSVLEFEQLGRLSQTDPTIAVLNLPKGRIVGDTLKPPADAKIIVKTPEGIREIH